jgi:hypothetical protein
LFITSCSIYNSLRCTICSYLNVLFELIDMSYEVPSRLAREEELWTSPCFRHIPYTLWHHHQRRPLVKKTTCNFWNCMWALLHSFIISSWPSMIGLCLLHFFFCIEGLVYSLKPQNLLENPVTYYMKKSWDEATYDFLHNHAHHIYSLLLLGTSGT